MSKKIMTSLDDLPSELQDVLSDYLHTNFTQRQKALQAGAEVFKSAIESATPKDTGKMAQSWQIKDKYADRRFVGNTRVASGDVKRKAKGGGKSEARKDVPLSNVLEYSEKSPHYGFIRQCFDSNETAIFNAIKNNLNGGN